MATIFLASHLCPILFISSKSSGCLQLVCKTSESREKHDLFFFFFLKVPVAERLKGVFFCSLLCRWSMSLRPLWVLSGHPSLRQPLSMSLFLKLSTVIHVAQTRLEYLNAGSAPCYDKTLWNHNGFSLFPWQYCYDRITFFCIMPLCCVTRTFQSPGK